MNMIQKGQIAKNGLIGGGHTKGVELNIINISPSTDMRLYTIYTPPERPEVPVHATKAEAEAAGH